MKNKVIYGIYDEDHYEQLLELGTAKNIAKYLNIKSKNVARYASSGKLKSNKYRVVKLNMEEEDEK